MVSDEAIGDIIYCKNSIYRVSGEAISDIIYPPRDVAQLGSALRSGRRGRRFKSCHPDHLKDSKESFFIGCQNYILSTHAD